MKKWKQCAKMITALVLALVMAAAAPFNAHASSKSGKYVSEVFVAYGKDAEDAKKTLGSLGFTPVEGNLNDGGKTYVMLGYKTTDDIRDSITDLAVMNMRGDYSVEDYKTLMKKQKTEIADAFCTTIQSHGYVPMVYGNPRWLLTDINLGYLTRYPVWLAHYTDKTSYPFVFSMWQYSNKAKVKGISRKTDMNIYFVRKQ